MMGTINCVYETPCGWCSKWDKKCDKKMHIKSTDEAPVNEVCKSEADHEWEWVSASTAENKFMCKKCGVCKVYPVDYSITTTTL